MNTLDVSALPDHYVHECEDGSVVDFAELLMYLRPTLKLMGADQVGQQDDSFGIAVSRFYGDSEAIDFDDYLQHHEHHIAFAGGWGPKHPERVAGAVRQMALLYEGRAEESTLAMVLDGHKFDNVVDSVELDGSFQMGVFPHSGAVWIRRGHLLFCISVSARHPIDDDSMAYFIGNTFAKLVLIGDGEIAA